MVGQNTWNDLSWRKGAVLAIGSFWTSENEKKIVGPEKFQLEFWGMSDLAGFLPSMEYVFSTDSWIVAQGSQRHFWCQPFRGFFRQRTSLFSSFLIPVPSLTPKGESSVNPTFKCTVFVCSKRKFASRGNVTQQRMQKFFYCYTYRSI